MDDADFHEQTLSAEEIFSGRLLHVHRAQVRLPDGKESTREWITHPGAVVVIAQLENGKLIFERQFRYPLQQIFLELPAGKIDSGEHIFDTARRELQEETGHTAKFWRHLGTMHTAIGYSNERIEIFLARELIHVGAALDEGEILEVVELSLHDALLGVRDGAITDAKTITALFWAEKILTGAWPISA
jgi:ADP-ribose pyrophosphatase